MKLGNRWSNSSLEVEVLPEPDARSVGRTSVYDAERPGQVARRHPQGDWAGHSGSFAGATAFEEQQQQGLAGGTRVAAASGHRAVVAGPSVKEHHVWGSALPAAAAHFAVAASH